MNLKGIGLFAFQINSLISRGKTETFSKVEEHFASKDIVEYIYNKYIDFFPIRFDNSNYDNKAINKYFSEYSGVIEGNESRKYGILNENHGLLLILALLFDRVEIESNKWEI